ncbi:MAG: prepilin peptidase, partial [Candidatus Dadabacteria bacterium]|nr:prepilin peptidase [Candidatus Dadabacteria bacterium]
DVKLVAMLGAFFGMWGVLIIIFLSSILGTLIGLSVIILRRKDPGYAIAYGPFLSLSAVLYLLGDGLFLLAGINIGSPG